MVDSAMNRCADSPAGDGTFLPGSIYARADIAALFSKILDSLALAIRHDTAALFLAKEGALVCRACRGFPDPTKLLGLRLPLEEYPLDRVILESGKPIVLPDVRADPRWNPGKPIAETDRIRSWMGIPLTSSRGIIGLLAVDGEEPGLFGEKDLSTALGFAELAAAAVENARLYAEAGRRLREFDAVTRIGQAVRSQLDVDRLCVEAGEGLLEVFGAGIVFVALYDAEAGMIATPFFWMDGKRWDYQPFPFGQGLSSRVIKSKRPLYFPDLKTTTEALQAAVLRAERPPKSWLGVPVISGGDVLGVLSVQSFDEENAFSTEDIRLLETIASTVGAGIANARLFAEVRRRADQAAALAEAGREISESLDLETVLGRIVERAALILTRDTTAVYLADETGTYRARVAYGLSAEAIRADIVIAGEGIIGRVIQTGRGEIVNDTLADPTSITIPDTPEDEPGEKLMAVPLFGHGKRIGAMAAWRGVDEPAFRRSDLEFLSGLARQAEVAIENARLHARAKDSAHRSAALYAEARRARAEAEEANQAKTRFLAAMSHELRTPLNSVINFAFLLGAGSEGELSRGQADLVSRIEEAGKHLLDLINDVLDLAKIEAGRMELLFEELDIAHLVNGVLSTAAGLVRGKGVELVAEIPEGLPPVVADRTRIRQVLLNLISNAAKFTERGSISIRARAGAEELFVEVEDTGIGMRPEDIPRAFAEFIQIDGDLDRRAGGTGLGLPLARSFVELHGGRMWAESEPGKGSSFHFSLPLRRMVHPAAAPETQEPSSAPASAKAPAASPAAPRVLIIDGDPESADEIARGLGKGYRVERLQDSNLALARARALKPDLVILDVMMPKLDGWELLRAFKADEETRDIPVVMCTVLNERALAISLGASDFVGKPVDLEELRSVAEHFAPAGGTVLAVDDDADALEILSRALSDARDGDLHER